MTPNRPSPNALKAGLAALAMLAGHWTVLPPGTARAEEPPVLRQHIEVHDDLVTLGDLFENAGLASEVPVFRSPDLGTSGVVAAARVAAAADRHGLQWTNRAGLSKVTVERPARRVTVEEVITLARSTLAARMGSDKPEMIKIELERSSRPILMSKQITDPLLIKRLELNGKNGRFTVTVGLEDRLRGVRDRSYRGRAVEEAPVAVLTRTVRRGETIEPDDVDMVRIAKSRVTSDMLGEPEQLTGMAAKRNLTAGRPLRERDIEAPKIVTRNQHVTIIFRFGRMHLKTMGRALGSAAKGEPVRVRNLRSKKILEAIAVAEEEVEVSGTVTGSILARRKAARSARR